MAGIAQAVRFIGMGDSIEIWAEAAMAKPFMEPDDFGPALQKLMSAGSPATSDGKDM